MHDATYVATQKSSRSIYVLSSDHTVTVLASDVYILSSDHTVTVLASDVYTYVHRSVVEAQFACQGLEP